MADVQLVAPVFQLLERSAPRADAAIMHACRKPLDQEGERSGSCGRVRSSGSGGCIEAGEEDLDGCCCGETAEKTGHEYQPVLLLRLLRVPGCNKEICRRGGGELPG
jgi:hypothetical protein